MQIGVVYSQTELRGDPMLCGGSGCAVEELGFDYLLAYDHVLGAVHADRTPQLTGPYTEHDPFHDPFVMFAYLAAITERIGFATGILILPQRQTALVARQAADLDLLSGGRLRLGVGSRLEPRRVRSPRTGVPDPRRAAGGTDRATAPTCSRNPSSTSQAGSTGSTEPHSYPSRHTPSRSGSVDPGEAAYDRAARLADGFIFIGGGWTAASTHGNGCANACAASAGRSRSSARSMSRALGAAPATSRPRSMPGDRQAEPTSRSSPWASAWTPPTAISTTSHPSQTR